MRRVIVESPCRGDFARNLRYARLCGRDSLARGESPYASHLLLTQFMDDRDPDSRAKGIAAGLAWSKVAELAAVYTDLGVSSGMRTGIAEHLISAIDIEYRTLSPEVLAELDAKTQAETPHAIGRDWAWFQHFNNCTRCVALKFCDRGQSLWDDWMLRR